MLDYQDIQFTESARQLLADAHDEARRLRHEYIGTEHLVLALTSQPQGLAATALRNNHVDLERVRRMIESAVHYGRADPPNGPLPYTTRTQKVLALAKEIALTFERREVSAEDLLIGVLREARGVGGQILAHNGASEDALVDEIKRLSADPPSP